LSIRFFSFFVFVKISSARKLLQLKLESAEKLLKLMAETSKASAPALAQLEAFSHHMITDTSQP